MVLHTIQFVIPPGIFSQGASCLKNSSPTAMSPCSADHLWAQISRQLIMVVRISLGLAQVLLLDMQVDGYNSSMPVKSHAVLTMKSKSYGAAWRICALCAPGVLTASHAIAARAGALPKSAEKRSHSRSTLPAPTQPTAPKSSTLHAGHARGAACARRAAPRAVTRRTRARRAHGGPRRA